jgi:GntR family transcriptional regulator/MocR family aminotransferase
MRISSIVTAAHQYRPAVLSSRAALASAERRDAVVVEDDYDAEFATTASRSVHPVGAGSDRLCRVRQQDARPGPARLAVAADIPERRGRYGQAGRRPGSPAIDRRRSRPHPPWRPDRHLRRSVARTGTTRHLARSARTVPAGVPPVGASAGLHVLAWLPPDPPRWPWWSRQGRRDPRVQAR